MQETISTASRLIPPFVILLEVNLTVKYFDNNLDNIAMLAVSLNGYIDD